MDHVHEYVLEVGVYILGNHNSTGHIVKPIINCVQTNVLIGKQTVKL